MNPQFEILCEKFGVAADQLWPMLVERTISEAKTGIFICSLLIVLSLVMTIWSVVHDMKEDDGSSIWGVCLGIPITILFSSILYFNIMNLRYPEVAALKSLFN